MDESKNSELSLIDLFLIIKQEWKKIFAFTFIFALLSLALAFLLPEKFTAATIVVPNDLGESNSGVNENISGIAALAGVDLSSSGTKKDEYIAILKSREFLYEFFDKYDVLIKLYSEDWNEAKGEWKSADLSHTNWKSYKDFNEEVLDIYEDIATGLITISIETPDPNLSAIWANSLIKDVNYKIQQDAINSSKSRLLFLAEKSEEVKIENLKRVIFSSIEREIQNEMMASVDDEYAFKIIDKAFVPELKSFPKRFGILISGTIIGFFFTVVFILLLKVFREER